MKSILPQFIFYVLCIVFLIGFLPNAEARIIYVHATAAGTGDGSSWTNAYTDLQVAMDAAAPYDSVFVAAGKYVPSHPHGADPIRNATFYFNKSILVFGGFSGDAGTEGNIDIRNPKTNITILSGDIGVTDDHSDNVFHVVFFDHVSDTARLDGFTVQHGNTTNASGFDAYGGGIYNDATAGISSPTIANCIIRDNIATESGGGMMNYASANGDARPLIINSSFINNRASGGGGAASYADDGGIINPLFINCTMAGNSAPTAQGGALSFIAHSSTSSPKLINCIVTGNDSPTSAAIYCFGTGSVILCPEVFNSAIAGNTGGALRVTDLGTQASRIVVRNSIFWNNSGNHGVSTNAISPEVEFSIMQFGFNGEGNLAEDPLFAVPPPLNGAHVIGDLHLQHGSAAIDAGRNSDIYPGVDRDLDNLPRFINPSNGQPGIVDMGPYEVQGSTTAVSDFLSANEWNVTPTISNSEIAITLSENKHEAQVRIFDANGRIVRISKLYPGEASATIDVAHLSPGNYFVHLMIDGQQDVKKIVVSE